MSISQNSQNIALDTKRHSMAHIMASAVKDMFPETQFGVGPVIENGCYYDFILPRTLIPEDLPLIEEKIRELLGRNLAFKRQEVSLEEAINLFTELNQPLKVELLNDLATRGTTSMSEEEKADFGDNQGSLVITIYRLVDEDTGEVLFEDLCKGPHVGSIGEMKSIGFALDKFSASYWRGDQKRDIRMQRLYALVFDTKEELKDFQTQREEAKKRDHRVLNNQLKLYTISELVGSGLALMQPKGNIIRRLIQNYLWQLHKPKSYSEVWTPHIAKEELYQTSGHAKHYLDDMFSVYGGTSKEKFYLKPMNCPHHMQLFADNQFSYRDMPIRYFEHATVYRDEKTGELSGLTRVRNITQDDGHLFCRLTQLSYEVDTIVEVIKEFMATFGMSPKWVSLSVRDNTDAWLGTDEMWDTAQKALKDAAIKHNIPYKIVEGEAAFYGPKLDFMYTDVIGREWQLSTIQVDFNLPQRFDLSFINENGENERPVVIHRAIGGSSERFMGVLIEHYAGRFPFWLSPVQIKILTINTQPETIEYVAKIKEILNDTVLMKPLKYNEIRFEVDDRSESLGKKIREAQNQKIPVILIVGPKDIAENLVSVRTQEGESKVGIEELEEHLKNLG